MGNGEDFLVIDWPESIRCVQFHKKEMFDAGAAPGLDGSEHPDLKFADGDFAPDLRETSDEKARQEDRIADLRQEINKGDTRIRQFGRGLGEARDFSRMANQFV